MILNLIILLFIAQANTKRFDTSEVIKKEGYKTEIHQVSTVDGYKLTIHRILPKNLSSVKKQPCLLIHGIAQSSMEFLQLQQDSLPFLLSDSGYDVYLGNCRGTQYSSHVKHSKNSSEFWDFSWHEIGVFDLSAMIDFVLDITNSENLFFVGLSQGSTIAMVLLSMKPEYNEKIAQAHLIGPGVFFEYFSSPLIKSYGKFILDNFSTHGMMNLTAISEILQPLWVKTCKWSRAPLYLICVIIEFMVLGGNIYRIEADIDVLGNFPYVLAPYVSEKQVLHFLQLIDTDRFKQFDYGVKNIEIYGTIIPPEYELNKVSSAVHIYHGGQDGFVHPKVSESLYLD